MSTRIAIVVSHPIQHFCPQYVSFSKNEEVGLKVFFASALGHKKYLDPNFKTEVSWGNLHLDKFEHTFLNGEKILPSGKDLDAPNLAEALGGFKPDLIIIYGYFQKLQRRAHQWASTNGVKLAYISDSELRHRRSRWKEMVKYFYIKRFFSKIDYFLSVGDANEEFYKYYGVSQSKIIRMNFPIDLIEYEKSFSEWRILRNKIREQYKIEKESHVLAVVGKLVQWKNQDHIIDAMKLLEEEGVYLHLFVLGSGEMLEPWINKSTILKISKVHFTGFVDIAELPSYYAAVDIYVHPASTEPHSIAISEAIYMGCPVIISDRCGSHGQSDDVQDGKNGYIFGFGNIRELATKIKSLINDVETRKKFGEYSHKISAASQQRAHQLVLNELINQMNDSLK
jgi:glycosyltransferase involved in cell wall biosynthesis